MAKNSYTPEDWDTLVKIILWKKSVAVIEPKKKH